jgi:hypothetical protein
LNQLTAVYPPTPTSIHPPYPWFSSLFNLPLRPKGLDQRI